MGIINQSHNTSADNSNTNKRLSSSIILASEAKEKVGEMQESSKDKLLARAEFLKKNEFGIWQSRVFVLKHRCLNYFKDEKRVKSDRPSGTISCSSIRDVWLSESPDADGFYDFKLELAGASSRDCVFDLKTKDHVLALMWKRHLSMFALDNLAVKSSGSKVSSMEGFLMKRSPANRHIWQKRYFILQNSCLYYQKDQGPLERGHNAKGIDCLNIRRMDLIRDTAEGCRFDILMKSGRPYALMAINRTQAQQWFSALEHFAPTEHAFRLTKDPKKVFDLEDITEPVNEVYMPSSRLLLSASSSLILSKDQPSFQGRLVVAMFISASEQAELKPCPFALHQRAPIYDDSTSPIESIPAEAPEIADRNTNADSEGGEVKHSTRPDPGTLEAVGQQKECRATASPKLMVFDVDPLSEGYDDSLLSASETALSSASTVASNGSTLLDLDSIVEVERKANESDSDPEDQDPELAELERSVTGEKAEALSAALKSSTPEPDQAMFQEEAKRLQEKEKHWQEVSRTESLELLSPASITSTQSLCTTVTHNFSTLLALEVKAKVPFAKFQTPPKKPQTPTSGEASAGVNHNAGLSSLSAPNSPSTPASGAHPTSPPTHAPAHPGSNLPVSADESEFPLLVPAHCRPKGSYCISPTLYCLSCGEGVLRHSIHLHTCSLLEDEKTERRKRDGPEQWSEAPLSERKTQSAELAFDPTVRFAVFNVNDPNGKFPVLSLVGESNLPLSAVFANPTGLVLSLDICERFKDIVRGGLVKIAFQDEQLVPVSSTGAALFKSFVFRGENQQLLCHERLVRSPYNFVVPLILMRLMTAELALAETFFTNEKARLKKAIDSAPVLSESENKLMMAGLTINPNAQNFWLMDELNSCMVLN